ncbi:sodium:solute symporter family transporter [Thalassoglobus sp.]|uniref:sodium:solute symporter family transporter n=1 Tax=Thalassoglobus sp. TaxID=2795869 RepID=UPI003AA7E138
MSSISNFQILAVNASDAAIWTFVVYTLLVFVIAGFANNLLKGRSFLSEYFLGSRGLGVWAFALTFAATSASGGSFTGFPAKIYTHGWILALWIASYMVYPLCTMGLLGKRVNQVARKSGAITIPDVLRDRFDSRSFGLVATLLIVFFLSFNLIAQFKAGSVILQTLIQDVDAFKGLSGFVGSSVSGMDFFSEVDPGYFTCLVLFGVLVIVYTTYGGFHAVVWTDVMQGVVMIAGVAIMLPLTLSQVGGLRSGTEQMARMVPPRIGTASIELAAATDSSRALTNIWIAQTNTDDIRQVYRLSGSIAIPAGERIIDDIPVVEIRTPEEIERLWEKFFSDLPESAWHQIGPSEANIRQTAVEGNSVLGATESGLGIICTFGEFQDYQYGADRTGHYVSGPAPMPPKSEQDDGPTDAEVAAAAGFLPLGMAISFFFMWAISGTGQPQYMVRLMAFKDSKTLRRAIITVTIYYGLIYFPLVVIFCYSRILLPGMENEADRIMPAMAVTLTENAGYGWLAGLLIAAPFAAVMSTVDSFLLVISSALVRDVYQRNISPNASETTIKRLCYLTTLVIGTIALVCAINPPAYLQDIIVYVGSGLAACFLFPVVALLFWKRSNTAGCLGSMLVGFATHLFMHVLSWWRGGEFTDPVNLFGFSPVVVALATSLIAVLVITPITPKPPEHLVKKYFEKE